ICLDDFALGDRIRQLYCRHVFHRECIDEWLLTKCGLCPICKHHCVKKVER
ncbi:hypothetical protein BJ085DRAFT_7086, partial [Dimargaris cristalligena]